MIWIEMARDPVHGGGDWDFTKSLWSPTHKQGASGTWPYWENLLRVRAGDHVLHLRGKNSPVIVGASVAESNGFRTTGRPDSSGEWSYATSFYRVILEGYLPFDTPIMLKELFTTKGQELRDYYEDNRNRGASRKPLFYAIQSDRLQCQNGAYLTEVDDRLAEILLGSLAPDSLSHPEDAAVKTGTAIGQAKFRIGQSGFSEKVRANYGGECCIPGCGVADRAFLVGSHIARWADDENLRGQVSNGLCLCLMHDKAFELGYFTLDEEYRVIVNRGLIKAQGASWAERELIPLEGKQIRLGAVRPSLDALRAHWHRFGLDME